MQENVTLNIKESNIEMDQVSQEGNQKINSKAYFELNSLRAATTRMQPELLMILSKEGTSSWIKPILCCLMKQDNLSLQILNNLGITMMQRIKKNGGWKLKKSSMI
jgi:hypothetical protein